MATASIMAPSATQTSSSTLSVPARVETKTLTRGVYVPVLTFFNNDAAESLDLDTFSRHVKYVASSGCAGIVVLGSTGERVSLNEEERFVLIKIARDALDDAGFKDMPLIAGAGDQSARMAIASIKSAKEAGASHVLVLPSSYYPNQLGVMGAKEFYTELANASPLPILIYSYPGVSSGITLSSELINELARHPAIRGVKHTDHDIGKMARHCALAQSDNRDFIVLGGASDYYIGALAVGAHGTITGMGNMAPRTVVEIQKLWDNGQYEKAKHLQAIVSCAEWELGKGGVPIHKAVLSVARGYGGLPRRPVQPSSKETVQEAVQGFAALMATERELEAR